MKALLFDVDDTLYDQTQPFQKAYEELFGARFVLNLEQLYVRSRIRSDEVFEPSQSGKITMEEMYIYRIQKAFEDLHVQITDAEALEFQRLYADNQGKLFMTLQMQQFLAECGKCYQLGVITNGPTVHQWKKIETLKLTQWIPKENIFVSGDLPFAKPDRAIFDYVAEKMELPTEAFWYVGDFFSNDIVGAKNAGWHAIWFNRRRSNMPEGSICPDRTVYDEAELIALRDIL